MPKARSSYDQLEIIGGTLALDFVNTVGWRGTAGEVEWLEGFDDIIAWGRRIQYLDKPTGDAQLRRGADDTRWARRQLRLYHDIRGLLHRIFLARLNQHEPDGMDIDLLNRALARMEKPTRIEWRGDRFRWATTGPSVETLISEILRDATALLTSERLATLKRCGGPECGWLFLDTSRGHRRRWCSMAICGNRAKTATHYKRHRAKP